MSVQAYTNVGALIWEWEPFIAMKMPDGTPDYAARNLWLALYTSSDAKRIVPGLFVGSITAMAEAAKMPVDDAMNALDRLLDREMVEFDQKHRVVRLTVLPDGLESPPNGKVIRGWFKRFKSVPACQVRDAHVATLAWIMDAWCRESGKTISEDHTKAWQETFALVTIPPPRRRGVRRLVDSHTGTDVQPGLFDPAPVPSSSSIPGSDAAEEIAIGRARTVSLGRSSEHDARSVDNSAQSADPKQIRYSDTVSKPFRNGSDPDPDPDPDLDLFFSGSGGETGVGEIANSTGSAPTPTTARTSTGRTLSLVPMPDDTPQLTPEALLQQLSEASPAMRPAIVREASRAALCATIGVLTARGVGPPELARISQHIARYGIPPSNAERWYQLSDWASDPERVLRTYAQLGTHERRAESASAELADIRRQLGYT